MLLHYTFFLAGSGPLPGGVHTFSKRGHQWKTCCVCPLEDPWFSRFFENLCSWLLHTEIHLGFKIFEGCATSFCPWLLGFVVGFCWVAVGSGKIITPEVEGLCFAGFKFDSLESATKCYLKLPFQQAVEVVWIDCSSIIIHLIDVDVEKCEAPHVGTHNSLACKC